MTYIEVLEYINIHEPVKFSELVKVFPPKTRTENFIRKLKKRNLVKTYYYTLVFTNNTYVPKKVYFDTGRPHLVKDYFIELSENARKILEIENTDSFYDTSMFLLANVLFGIRGVKLYDRKDLEYKETVEKMNERKSEEYRKRILEAVENAIFGSKRAEVERQD